MHEVTLVCIPTYSELGSDHVFIVEGTRWEFLLIYDYIHLLLIYLVISLSGMKLQVLL
jgi:hypothetical protein